MAWQLAETFVEVSLKGLPQVESGIASVKAQSTGLIGSFTSLQGAAAGLGVALTAGVLFKGLGSCIQAFGEAEEAGAKLAAVVKSTGGAAGVSAAEIQQLTADLQRVTKFEDDAASSAVAMLLTFTSIKGPIFKDAVRSAYDLSTVMGQDLRSSIMQIGKALQDPVAGITALRRSGVSFSEEQRAEIEKLVSSGNLQKAQLMILAELHKEVGGAAEAAGNTTLGKIEQMKNAWGDLAETIGGKVAPALTEVAELLTKAMQGPAVTKDQVDATIAGGKLAAIREQQQRLQAEERELTKDGVLKNYAKFGAVLFPALGMGNPLDMMNPGLPKDNSRLAEIQREQARLREAAAKASVEEAEKREKADIGARALQGAGLFGAPNAFASRLARGARGSNPDDELRDDHDKLKNLDSYFSKMAATIKKARDEASHILDGAMTPAEKLEQRVERIRQLINTPGSGMTEQLGKKAADAARRDFLGADKDAESVLRNRIAELTKAHAIPEAHGGINDADFEAARQRAIDDFAAHSDDNFKSSRFGIQDLQKNIQQSVLDGEAKRLAREQAENIANMAQQAKGAGLPVKIMNPQNPRMGA